MGTQGSKNSAKRAGISLVICCHNSSARLPDTIRHLAVQRVPEELPWEVLVIDNASTDDTIAVAQRCWPNPPPAPLRVVREPKLGVGNARLRSFTEARGDIISFIDDDNWVGPDWVAKVSSFFDAHPQAVAVGGPSRAIFEAPPPEWFGQVAPYFAVGEPYPVSGDITDHAGALLWGAGMSFRRSPAVHLLQEGFQLLLCGGDELAIKTGEDTEIGFALRAGGGRLYYELNLGIDHYMPSGRLTWSNARRMLRSMGEASVVIELYAVALETPAFKGRPGWRTSWLFFYLKAVWAKVRILAANPFQSLSEKEGSMPALALELARGRLATLWALWGRFERTKQQIKNAPWAKAASR